MPRVIDPEVRASFYRWIQQGWNLKEAARRAGVSYAWAKKERAAAKRADHTCPFCGR